MNTADTDAVAVPDETLRARFHDLLSGAGRSERHQTGANLVEAFLVFVIITNTLCLILWTVDSLEQSYRFWFYLTEFTTIAVFAVEYCLRFWVAPESDPSGNPWRQRWRFVRSTTALIDMAALAPSLIACVILLWHGDSLNLTFLLAIRLLTRSAKMARYLPGGRRLGMALRMKAGQMGTAVVGLVVVLVFAATMMYFAESKAQPDTFSSIPAAMWWSVVTLTTVGYGDTVPVTGLGRMLAAVIAVLGIGLFALPAGIISAAMMEIGERENSDDRAPTTCPHCGGDLTKS